MAAEPIGKAKCPLCASPKANVTLSKKGLACLTCLGCSCQIFARSAVSDEKLRGFIIPAEGAPRPAPEPKPEPKPAPKPEPKPAPAARDGWDPYA